MSEVCTVGIWSVKPGREEDFVAAWQVAPYARTVRALALAPA